jgi:hypothetical protein
VKDELAIFGGYGVAGFGPLVAVTLLSPLRDEPLVAGIVVFLLIAIIAAAAALTGPKLGAVATLNSALWVNFLFVKPYGILKPAGVLQWPILLVVLAGFTIVAIARRSRRAPVAQESDPRPTTAQDLPPSRHIQRVGRLIEQRADERDLTAAVEIELTSLLAARSCRFEAGPVDLQREPPVVRLERDGTFSGPTGDADRLEIVVQTATRDIGRFLVDLNPGAAIPFERRLVAVIVVDHLAAAIDSRHPSTPLPHKEFRWFQS